MPKKTTASPSRTLSVSAAVAAAAAAAAPSAASSASAPAAADAAAVPALGYLVRHSAVLLLIAMNVSASVALVGVNKYLVLAHGFRFVLLLSGLHFAVGYALLHGISAPGCGSARSFERKVPPLWQSLPAALAGMGSIVCVRGTVAPSGCCCCCGGGGGGAGGSAWPNRPSLLHHLSSSPSLSCSLMNYSLRTNTVGSYQMLKVAVLPATIALAAVQGTRITSVDLGTAFLVSAGTAIATVTDVDLTLGGGAIGLAAVLATAQYQVAQGRIQKESELTSTQAMHAISLPQAVLTLGASLVLETAWERFAGSGGAGGSGSSAKEIAALRGVRSAGPVPARGGAPPSSPCSLPPSLSPRALLWHRSARFARPAALAAPGRRRAALARCSASRPTFGTTPTR